mmetsp:Transcript_8226/g.7638  ORF Transcript_8226/g.7638 Transcript_8226/m.7638 type:complete len:138 (+) Transcript_8226:704-1117(+)
MKSEDFRKKLEERQAIEAAKPLEDKHGDKAWQMKLRTPNRCKSKKISNFFQVGNPSLGLHMKVLDKEAGEVEVIRRPFSSYAQKTEKPEYKEVPVTEKSFQKISEYGNGKRVLKQLESAKYIENLCLFGQNKFKLER